MPAAPRILPLLELHCREMFREPLPRVDVRAPQEFYVVQGDHLRVGTACGSERELQGALLDEAFLAGSTDTSRELWKVNPCALPRIVS